MVSDAILTKPASPALTAASAPHICVCICTFRRPELLRRLFDRLLQQEGAAEGKFTLSAVVVDNDAAAKSAQPMVENFRSEAGAPPVVYAVETARNFALVRNRAVSLATGDFVAFIDDDEVPEPAWLRTLLDTQARCADADGVLGPVRPYFDAEPPRWIRRGRLCERPAHPTGMALRWSQTRTGNVLLKREIFTDDTALAFDPAFAAGGEDVDFFKRAMRAGRRFVWCEEAPAYEIVPPERWRVSYFLKRALHQGRTSARYACEKPTLSARLRIGLHALTALVLYALFLPFTLLCGFHLTMKYLIKSCHHLGRLQAIATAASSSPAQRGF